MDLVYLDQANVENGMTPTGLGVEQRLTKLSFLLSQFQDLESLLRGFHFYFHHIVNVHVPCSIGPGDFGLEAIRLLPQIQANVLIEQIVDDLVVNLRVGDKDREGRSLVIDGEDPRVAGSFLFLRL